MARIPATAYGIFQKAAASVTENAIPLTSAHVIAAVSGGLDSMVMLRFLHWLTRHYPFQIQVAHVNHGLRETAAQEAELVQTYAHGLGVPCVVHVADVEARAAADGEGLEAAGRRERYDFFASLVAKQAGTVITALAHHMDDQAETVLQNMTRGAGLQGIAAMHPYLHGRWRPLLQLRRHELVLAARDLQIPFAVDHSNESDVFLRNRVRHQLLPMWQAVAGFDVTEKLASLAAHASDDSMALDVYAERAFMAASVDGGLHVATLRLEPDAVIRRVLDKGFAQVSGAHLSSIQVANLQGIFDRTEACIDLPHGVQAVIRYGVLTYVT